MRYTLLELTQRILESMESDEVSTVGETPESLSVANIIKECYFDIVGELSMAEQEGLYKLDASGDNAKPTLMTIPTTVSSVKWVKYNIGESVPDYQFVSHRDNEEFLYYNTGLDPSETNIGSMVVSINGKSFTFNYYNDRMPTYYTVFDDQYVIFDAYDDDIESTLTEARCLIFATLVPSFSLTDTWTPDLDPRQFQLLLQEAKAQAFVELKQTQNPTAERKARKNKISAQWNKRDNNPGWANQAHAQFGRNGRNGFPRTSMERAMRKGK